MRQTIQYLLINLLCLSALLISGCAKKTSSTNAIKTPSTNQPIKLTETRKQLSAQPTGFKQLIKTLDNAYLEGEFDRVIQLTQQSISLLREGSQKNQLLAYQAQAWLSLNYLNLAEQSVQAIKPANPQQVTEKKRLQVKLYQARNQHIQALKLLFELTLKPTQFENDFNKQIWFHLSQLPLTTLQTFQSPYQSSLSSGWLDLALTLRQHVGNPSALHRSLKTWGNKYPSHPAISQVPQSFKQALETKPYKPQNVAVLLPLSGKFRKQAQAIRNGLLTAYDDRNTSIHFIDTNNMESALNQLETLQADFVIGPLLKENIEQYIHTSETQHLPTLLLNTPNQVLEKNYWYYFGLNRQDELQQAARHLVRKGYKFPAVIAPKTAQGQRLSQQFNQYWLDESKRSTINIDTNISTPEQVYFSTKADMQSEIKKLMDVSSSKARISRMKRIVSNNLKTETRSRKDLDVVYVIANPTQTRLLKPYIDVNTSTFAGQIPIYASSKSHSADVSKVDYKDLTSLIFTEMPWLLDFHQEFTRLRQVHNTLWQDNNDDQLRLFALGYDAWNLIGELAQLRVLPASHIAAMTGNLSIESNGKVTRELTWGRYAKGKIERINPQI